ncbi:MAG: hypothetical protein WEB58_23255 [Planctomycetaceae bacterium]
MTETATQVLAAFESLSPEEQHEVITAILRRSGELPQTAFADDALVGLADELFQVLDAEESDGACSPSR